MNVEAQWENLGSRVSEAFREGVFDRAALCVGSAQEELFRAGFAADGSNAIDTIFDLSSLTKVLATVSSLLSLFAEDRVGLDTPLAHVLPEFVSTPAEPDSRRATVTIGQALNHCSGLPAHREFFRRDGVSGYDAILTQVLAEPLEYEPGTRAVYSDLGFILLGEIVSRIGLGPFEEVVQREVMEPLGLQTIGFRSAGFPSTKNGRDIAACGDCAWRGEAIEGVAQDENAFAMGGVAGHAGLFSDVGDVSVLAREYLRAYLGSSSVFSNDWVRRLWVTPIDGASTGTWAYGWDTPDPVHSSAGQFISRRSFGHLGYTGTSIWVDTERQVYVILLTNRLIAGRDHAAIRRFRPLFHDEVFKIVDSL